MSLAGLYEDGEGDYLPSDFGRLCTKKAFPSIRVARLATRKIGNRIRVYYCGDCRAFHISNAEKR